MFGKLSGGLISCGLGKGGNGNHWVFLLHYDITNACAGGEIYLSHVDHFSARALLNLPAGK